MTRLLEALELVEVDGERVYRCLRCERVLGSAREHSYQDFAVSYELPVSAGVPAALTPPASEFVLRHHCCPGCAVLFEVEMVAGGAEPLPSADLSAAG